MRSCLWVQEFIATGHSIRIAGAGGHSMKITAIESRREHFETAAALRDLVSSQTGQRPRNAIVMLHTDTGLVGYGAGSPEHHVTGETIAGHRSGADARVTGLAGR